MWKTREPNPMEADRRQWRFASLAPFMRVVRRDRASTHDMQMDRIIVQLIFCVLLSMVLVSPLNALAKGPANPCLLSTLVGEIDALTPVSLKTSYAALNEGHPEQCRPVMIQLNSNGGNVEAAIEAGEFIRQKKITTIVPADSSCASACVLLHLGGVHRLSVGKVGIHRPFYDRPSRSDAESRATYERLNDLIRRYLKKMNVPDIVLGAMNAVPPGEIRWLTKQQREDFQIDGEDPVFADQRDSLIAKRLGISKKELYSRQQRAKTACAYDQIEGSLDRAVSSLQCYNRILSGAL